MESSNSDSDGEYFQVLSTSAVTLKKKKKSFSRTLWTLFFNIEYPIRDHDPLYASNALS